MTQKRVTDPKDIIYTPSEFASIGQLYLDERRTNNALGIPIGLPSLDRDFLPLLRGELVSIIGRPGAGKTGFMTRWARHRAAWLRENAPGRLVVYVTFEQSIEDLYAFDIAADTEISITKMARGEIGEAELRRMHKSSIQAMEKPLWYIGFSMERREKRPLLSISTMTEALELIEKWEGNKYTIDIVFVDYLQRIPFDGRVESKTIGMDDNLNDLKDAALAFGCPIVIGVQARREVDRKSPPIPQMDDGQWTSAIEQVSDKILSVVRPSKYVKEGEYFSETMRIPVSQDQMIITILKQKLGVSNKAYWARFNPIYNRLDELEIRHVNLNDE